MQSSLCDINAVGGPTVPLNSLESRYRPRNDPGTAAAHDFCPAILQQREARRSTYLYERGRWHVNFSGAQFIPISASLAGRWGRVQKFMKETQQPVDATRYRTRISVSGYAFE